MEKKRERKAHKVNFWHVVFCFGGVWAFILLGHWSGLVLLKAWEAIKENAMASYAIVSQIDNVLKAGVVALCVSLIYAIYIWLRTVMHREPKKQRPRARAAIERAPVNDARKDPIPPERMLHIEQFDEGEERKNCEDTPTAPRTRRRPQNSEETEEASTFSDGCVGEENG